MLWKFVPGYDFPVREESPRFFYQSIGRWSADGSAGLRHGTTPQEEPESAVPEAGAPILQ